MKTFAEFLKEKLSSYLILLPGGYKPPTKGHLHLIQQYNNNPSVAKILILIGPTEREGITREQALQVFNLYGVSKLPKVIIESTSFESPLKAAFEFVENDPRAESYKSLIFSVGASNKGDDFKRSSHFASYFKKNPQKLRSGFQVGVPPIVSALKVDDSEASATTLRKAIRDTDIQTIRKLIPENVNLKTFLRIFNK